MIKGGRRLKGEVRIGGAKNAALPLLAATLLAEGWHSFGNIPQLDDVRTMKKLLAGLGAEINDQGKNLKVNTDNLNNFHAPYDLVKTMRASILVLGPLTARIGKARISLPGGCAIGARPVDLHLKGMEALGAKIELKHGYIEAEADKLHGATIYFDIPTVTGTENVMMAATLADGETILKNAACEPEVADLAEALNRMGAKVSGAGSDTVVIEGVRKLKALSHYQVMPDRIEAGTFMIASGITRGDIKITHCNPIYLDLLISKLLEAGLVISRDNSSIVVTGGSRVKSFNIKTLPYPGFPTDLQAQMMSLAALAQGTSIISETVFENRFMHVHELKRMGADIRIEGNSAIVRGVNRLSGAPVMATDLRASASLILAGLAAGGETEVSRIYHLDRGYQNMVEKFAALGADIKRIRS